MSSTKRSQILYLHLKPGQYQADLSVVKVAKSLDATVEPGAIVVKTKVTVPGDFFAKAVPYVELEIEPGNEQVPVVQMEVSE